MKIRSIKSVTILLSFTACFIQASESLNQKTWFSQAMDLIGQSSFIHAYSKHVQTKIDGAIAAVLNSDDQQPASPHYQELGSQAQYALGIAQKDHLPIKKFMNNSSFPTTVVAMAESDAIYVNEKKLNKRAYGSQRSIMFHEATHVKYHDSAVSGIIKQAGFWGGTMGAYVALKAGNVIKLRKSLSVAVGLAIMVYGEEKVSYFMEQRADTQGHYATQCSKCVTEGIHFKVCRKLQSDSHKLDNCLENSKIDQRYLTQAELEQIAQDLGDKTCDYHSEQQK